MTEKTEYAGIEFGPPLTPEQQRLCALNIELLKTYKAAPPPVSAPPQRHYVAKPLTTPVLAVAPAGPSKRELKHAANAARIEAKYHRKFEPVDPVRVTATAPYPQGIL